MFVDGFSFPINLGSLSSSPFFIVFLVIVVPLLGFALYLQFVVLGRRNSSRGVGGGVKEHVGTSGSQPVQAQTEADRDEEVTKMLSQVNTKIDRAEANITKALASSLGEIMGELKNVSQKVEDAVLAIKAAQSDAASPFNALVIPSNTNRGGSNDEPSRDALDKPVGERTFKQEFDDYDLGKLLEACAVLEILNYNREQIEWLFEVGLLTVEHLELIGRIEHVLEKYGSGLKAKDIAEIVLKTNSPQAMFQETARRVLRVLHEMGDGGAGRSGQ